MASTLAEIQVATHLIDDYLYLQKAPVDDDLNNRFLVVQNLASNETASELLSVDQDGNLVRFRPDTSSQSGWATETVAVPPPGHATAGIERLVGFYDRDVLQTLVYFGTGAEGVSAARWMKSTAPGTWVTAELTNDAANALYYTYQTDTYVDADHHTYVYGITKGLGEPSFFVVLYDENEQKWDVINYIYLSTFSPQVSEKATFRMARASQNDQATVLWVEPGSTTIHYQTASLAYGGFQFVGSPKSIDTSSVGAISVDRIIPFPGSYGADQILVLDTSGALYVVSGYNAQQPKIIRLTDPGAAQGSSSALSQGQPTGAFAACVGIDQSGTLTLFALEKGTTGLWYMFSDQSGQFDPTQSWVNLAGQHTIIACPETMIYGPELFKVNLGDDSVYHHARTLADQVWLTSAVAAPAPASPDDDQPANIGGYAMEVTALDDTGGPIANRILYVVADHAVTIIIGDLTHRVGPGAPIPFTTDGSGQATIRFQAEDLKPPQFTFSEVADGSGVARWCQGDVVEIKSGEDPLPPLPNTVGPTLQSIDGQTLTDNGLVSPDYDDPDDAAKAISASAPWLDPNTHNGDGTVDSTRIAVRHWSLDFTAPGGTRFRELSGEEARALRESALLGSSTGFGDVCHFFKHLWQDLEKFVATVENDVLTVILNGTSYIISTAKQAADAIETIFTRIIEGLKDLYQILKDIVAFLKMLFEWKDILNTHEVLKQVVNATFDNLQKSASSAEQEFAAWFSEVKSTITSAFDDLEVFAEKSFNEFVNALSASTGPELRESSGDTLDGDQQKKTAQQHSPRSNRLMHQANSSYASQSVSVMQPALQAGASPSMDGINAAFGQTIDITEFTNLSKDIEAFFTDPSKFFDQGIAKFAKDGAEDLVNYVVDDFDSVGVAALEEIPNALSAVQASLNAKIHVPVISWLYKYAITGSITNPGDDLTFLDLICLIQAVPATILYKVEKGRAPFSSGDAGLIKQNGMPWPTTLFGTAFPATRLAASAEDDDLESVLEALKYVGVGIEGFKTIFFEPITDCLAAASVDGSLNDDEKSLVMWVSWADLVAELFLLAIEAPRKLFGESSANYNAADVATVALWSWRCVPLIIECVCTVSEKAELKFQEGNGPVYKSCLGVVGLGFGIWAGATRAKSGSGYDGYETAVPFLKPLPGTMKFLIMGGEDGAVVLAVIDFFVGIGVTVLELFHALEED